jgi:hypothetical protein
VPAGGGGFPEINIEVGCDDPGELPAECAIELGCDLGVGPLAGVENMEDFKMLIPGVVVELTLGIVELPVEFLPESVKLCPLCQIDGYRAALEPWDIAPLSYLNL